MSKLKYIGMAGGIANFINKVGAAIATAIGTALAGPIGGTVALMTYNAVVGDDLGNWVEGAANRGLGLNGPGMREISQEKQEKLLNWLKDTVQPWLDRYLDKDLHKETDNDTYKRKVNQMLINLEALRLMYKAEAKTEAKAKNFGNVSVEDFKDIKAKSEFFKLLSEIVRETFIDEMKRRKVEVFTKQINGFDPSRYEVDGPENISYVGQAKTSVKLFVFDALERLNITYDDGEEVSEDDDVENAESILNDNKGLKIAATIFGILGGGYVLRKVLKI